MNKNDYNAIQSLFGYEFKDKTLLGAAFTHASFVNEHNAIGNERLEFLGDCVINLLVGEWLFVNNPFVSEGELTSRRAALVSKTPLSRLVDELGIIKYLQVGAGVDKSKFKEKPRSDLFEAIIGGVYLDGGLDRCRDVLKKVFYGNIEPEPDYKSTLQEFAVARGLAVNYEVLQCDDGFTATVTVGNTKFFGKECSKQKAEINAAQAAVKRLMQS